MSMSVFSSLKRKVTDVYYRINRKFFFDESQVIYNGKTFKSYWDEFYNDDNRSFLSKIRAKAQAKDAFLEEGFRPDEFCLLGLENNEKAVRDVYISRKKKDDLLISYYGSDWGDILHVLKDKYVFYSYLKSFFKRDVTYIGNQEDRDSFLLFCNRHRQFFAKLNKGRCGIGAKVFAIKDDNQANKVFDELICSGEWVIEELIKQSPEIAAFNSSSVNTVRFPSFKKNGVVTCAFPCMRFGRAGSVIDNAAQGGLIVSIDEMTGELYPNAYDEKGSVYASHPDSKVPFCGFRVPQWDGLLELIKEAHLALPDNQIYVAFDVALSNRGWCIVEGNWGDLFLQQLSLKKGLKSEFVSLLNGNS
jgi:hypothetical protein